MVILDESGNVLDSPDLGRGRVELEEMPVVHRYVVDSEEQGHWETVAEYDNSGKDVEWVVDSEEKGHWETRDEGGEIVEHYNVSIPDDWPKEQVIQDVWQYGLYVEYTEEELAEIEHQREEEKKAAQQQQSIYDGSKSFFVDGGKEAMERSIEEAAASGGTDPQLQAIARMQVMTMDLTSVTSTECVAFRDYWPDWQPDTKYEYQQPLQHKGKYYRASKALTSSEVYPPDTAGESEYYPVEVAPDGVIVYRECHGQYDMVRAGETRHYPDAEGPVYRARVDTAYDPDTVPDNWELAQR